MFVTIPVGLAQSGTNESGRISSNTTWARANSPYNLIDDVQIAVGATLTIESGTEVKLNGKTLEVDGTLHAACTANDPIVFNTIPVRTLDNYDGGISFTYASKSWNQQTGSGSIIQNALFNTYNEPVGVTIEITNSSPKIDNNSFELGIIEVNSGSPIISNNQFSGGAIDVGGGSPIISNNTVTIGGEGDQFSGNVGINIWGQNTAIVFDNHVYSNITGLETNTFAIMVGSGKPVIARNFLSNNNQITTKSTTGILVYSNASPQIENNTFFKNTIGLNIYDSFGSPTPIIVNNNFEQNLYNIYLGQRDNPNSTVGNINATNNWWGTTDQQAINHTIHDSKDSTNLGTVTFIPFLNSPNTQALPNPNIPITTPNTSTSPTPTVPEFSCWQFYPC